MDALVDMIIGDSVTLDMYVIVRIIILCMALELFSVACGLLAGLKK